MPGFCGRRGHRRDPCTKCGGCFTCCNCYRDEPLRHKLDSGQDRKLTLCGLAYPAGPNVKLAITSTSPSCPRCARVWAKRKGSLRVKGSMVRDVSYEDRLRDYFTVTGRTLA